MNQNNLLYNLKQHVHTPKGTNFDQNFNTHSFRTTIEVPFIKIKEEEVLRQTLSKLNQSKVSKSMLGNWNEISSSRKLLTGLAVLKK